MCRGKRVPERYQIFAKIASLKGSVNRLSNNLADSWWETFNVGSFTKERTLYESYVKVVRNSGEEVYCVKSALEQMHFEGSYSGVKDFAMEIFPELEALKTTALHMLLQCVHFCQDGLVSPAEKGDLLADIEKLRANQAALSRKFAATSKKMKMKLIEPTIAPVTLVVFALPHWAQEISDFAEEVSNFEERWA